MISLRKCSLTINPYLSHLPDYTKAWNYVIKNIPRKCYMHTEPQVEAKYSILETNLLHYQILRVRGFRISRNHFRTWFPTSAASLCILETFFPERSFCLKGEYSQSLNGRYSCIWNMHKQSCCRGLVDWSRQEKCSYFVKGTESRASFRLVCLCSWMRNARACKATYVHS